MQVHNESSEERQASRSQEVQPNWDQAGLYAQMNLRVKMPSIYSTEAVVSKKGPDAVQRMLGEFAILDSFPAVATDGHL